MRRRGPCRREKASRPDSALLRARLLVRHSAGKASSGVFVGIIWPRK
jgi:hypothetical protein